jgi:hypothetical protein
MQRYPDLEGPQGYQHQQPMANGGMVGQGYPMNHKAAAYMMPDQAVPAPQKGGFQKLQDLDGIFIKQKMELLEVVSGCETENKYHVFTLDKSGKKKGQRLFKCKEKSSCCARQCMSGDCRPFRMEISTLVRGEDDEYEPFLRLERECKCTCLCFQRPEILVTLVEGGKNEYLGKIVDPWNCCNMEFNIFDKDHNKKFNIEGSCCQLGVWCQWPCEACQTIDFDVKTPSGEVVSSLQKKSQGCLKAAITDADNFLLHFPKNCTLTDKALLMSSVLFIDFRHFERTVNDEQNPTHNH